MSDLVPASYSVSLSVSFILPPPLQSALPNIQRATIYHGGQIVFIKRCPAASLRAVWQGLAGGDGRGVTEGGWWGEGWREGDGEGKGEEMTERELLSEQVGAIDEYTEEGKRTEYRAL